MKYQVSFRAKNDIFTFEKLQVYGKRQIQVKNFSK